MRKVHPVEPRSAIRGRPPEEVALGRCTVAGHEFLFLRLDGRDVAFVASPRDHASASGPRTFVAEGRALVVSAAWGPETTGTETVARAAAKRLLASEDMILTRIRKRESAGVPARPLPREFPASAFRFAPGESTSYSVKVPPRSRTVVVDVGARGMFPLDLLWWSARFAAADEREAGPLSEDETAYARQFFLATIARYLLGEGPPRVTSPSDVEGADAGRFPSLALDLSIPLPEPEGMPGFPADAEYVLLNLELPSQCDSRCVFCEKNREGSGPVLPADEEVATRLEALAERLSPALARVGRTDISLGGKDCLSARMLEPVLKKVAALPRIGKVNLVTPGTRLAEPGLAARLKELGVARVTTTLLGPDEKLHDAIAGRAGAFADLMRGLDEMKAAGLPWDLNTVVVRQNLERLADTLRRAGCAHVLFYVADPGATRRVFRKCCPRYADFARVLEVHRDAVEGRIRSLHYVPHCTVPDWARGLIGHSRRTTPDAPDCPPAPCAACRLFGNGCCSLGRRYMDEYGADELHAL